MQRIICPFEIKADSSDNEMIIRGYGSTFGKVDSYGDIVAPGAFTKTINDAKSGEKSWPAMLLQHGDDTVDGRMPVGVWLDMSQDSKGLRLSGKLAPTKRGKDVYNLLRMAPRPALNGLSIGYRVRESENHKSGPARRTIKAADLVEISLVTFPANRLATVTSVKTYVEPEPVIVDWEEVARADFERMRRLMDRNGR
jgi:HK97 family phage prohead protease